MAGRAGKKKLKTIADDFQQELFHVQSVSTGNFTTQYRFLESLRNIIKTKLFSLYLRTLCIGLSTENTTQSSGQIKVDILYLNKFLNAYIVIFIALQEDC